MKFVDPLISGRLIKRYKRFLADVELENGKLVTAHCANSGSMRSINQAGSEVWLSPAQNPNRKLKFTLELIKLNKSYIGVNTALPNLIVEGAIRNKKISELEGYSNLRKEVKYGKNSRIDILLEDQDRSNCYVEVKSVTMKRGLKKSDPVEFPDAVTKRGTKHLSELTEMVAKGHRSVMFYLVQRQDSDFFTIAADIDPDYNTALEKAIAAGVEVLCYQCKLDTKRIEISRPLKLSL